MSHTIAAVATPLSAGGIGVIRISGDDAIEIADRVIKTTSGKALSSLKGYTAAQQGELRLSIPDKRLHARPPQAV